MPPDIRQIREEDIESFYDTFSGVVNERRYLAFLTPPPIEQSRAFVMRNIAKGYPHLVAVTNAGKVAGWCDVTPPGRDVMAHVGVLGMALAPQWRGQGLGQRLILAAMNAAQAFGFQRLELTVYAHNAHAQALYRKVGFQIEGRRPKRLLVEGVFHDEIMMGRLF